MIQHLRRNGALYLTAAMTVVVFLSVHYGALSRGR